MRNCIGLLLAVMVLMLSGCGHMDFPAGRAYFDTSSHAKVPDKFYSDAH